VMMCKILSDGATDTEAARLANILKCHYWVAAPVFAAFAIFIAPSLMP